MITEFFTSVVMQPSTVCNMDCSYCYLPTRHLNLKMSPWVAVEIAEAIAIQNSEKPVTIIWHGGEPLATGISHFSKLMFPFEDLRLAAKLSHSVQTNGTLIDSKWCNFFRQYQFRVGISIDGPERANINRVDLAGESVFPKIIRGIELLKKNCIPFGVIAVVHEANIERPEEFYEFFCRLGCDNLAINIEEVEGTNTHVDSKISEGQSYDFWKRLFHVWKANPLIRIREFDSTLKYMDSVLSNQGQTSDGLFDNDLFPTVGWDGKVYLLSPEFGGYEEFVAGTLMNKKFIEILAQGKKISYVVDFEKGVKRCRAECPYFQACRGGYASNKYFEHGSTNATETAFCRNTRKRLLDAILDSV